MSNILALDLGTTALKSLVLAIDGKVLYDASVPYPTRCPRTGWVEQDPDEWEKALLASLAVMQEVITLDEIAAISFAGHMSSVVLVDAEGAPCYPCITLADSRSEAQTQQIRSDFSEEIAETTGNRVQNAFALPKLLWLRQEQPEAFARCAFWISAKDYLRFLLTGTIVQDTTDAFNSLCLDMRTLDWNRHLVKESGLPIGIFPRVLLPFEEAGHVTQRAAEKFGLKRGTPVYAGGADMACAAVSMGLKNQGEATISLGTNAPFMMMVQRPDRTYSDALTFHVGVQKNSAYGLGSHFNAGAAINSFSSMMSPEDAIDYSLIQKLSEKASTIPPGCDGLLTLPFLVGSGSPYFSPTDRGSVVGIDPATTKAHLFRSLLEGITLNIRQTFDIFSALAGGNILSVSLFGGGTKIPLWPHIIADVLGMPVQIVSNSSASALGAALMGGLGAGIFTDTSRITQQLFSSASTVENDPMHSEAYEAIYERYLALYNALKPIYSSK